ncbi:extracellular solute-binding protein [Dethiothermospora halolimnae]|uniref:extracellular solute-binding protein n=1 Tax=Dethiothermospora halolimnae TaxID=3114390 RepID=UPI003CCB928E
MKRSIIMILWLTLVLVLFGCGDNSETSMKKKMEKEGPVKVESEKNSEDKTKEITIVINGTRMMGPDKILLPIDDYTKSFQSKNNVKVTYDVIRSTSYEDYMKKLNTRLYEDNGPTLICFSGYVSPSSYIDKGVALDVSNKISNLKNIYSGLKKEKMFYVPIGMYKNGTILNREVLKSLDIKEPTVNWTKKGYLNIKKKWLKERPREFNTIEYGDIVVGPLMNLDIIDIDNKKVSLNNNRVKNYLNTARSKIFSGDYKLKEDYNYYYKMIFEAGSEEYLEQVDKYMNDPDDFLKLTESPNILRLVDRQLKNDKYLILPNVDQSTVKTFGFMINKKGEDIELGLKYINGLLNNKNQRDIYHNRSGLSYYPVNEKIEGEILKWDKEKGTDNRAIKLRKVVLDELRNKKVDYLGMDKKMELMYYDIEKDLFSLIFTDKKYNEEELEKELTKLEGKYNIIINE